jgi:hypothetical protein
MFCVCQKACSVLLEAELFKLWLFLDGMENASLEFVTAVWYTTENNQL